MYRRAILNLFKMRSLSIFYYQLIPNKVISKLSTQNLPGILLMMSFFSSKIKPLKSLADKIAESDRLFDESKFNDAIVILKSIENYQNKYEILWRISQCLYYKVRYETDPNSTDFDRLLNEMKSTIERCLEINEKSGPAHKWAALIIDAWASHQGVKERCKKLETVKNHMEKAILYSPNDPAARYILGELHYACCAISWFDRKIANLMYGKIPDSDYETALKYFTEAEQLEPGFLSKNELMIAKTLIKLDRDHEKVKFHLRNVVVKYFNSKKIDDVEAVAEAKNLLNQLAEKYASFS